MYMSVMSIMQMCTTSEDCSCWGN